jgi:uncharacterized membrane-anchored protein
MTKTSLSKRWVEHEARPAILAELHARPFLPVETPRRVYHYAFAVNPEEAAADRAAIAQLARSRHVEAPARDARFHYFDFGDWRLRWERHTEFTTYSWSTGIDAREPFRHPDPIASGEIAFAPPGRLIVATQLAVVGREPTLDDLVALGSPQSLCVIGVGKNAGEALTDFAVDDSGYTRMALRVPDAPPLEAGRLTQRLLEVETYRSMALLGLPLAREVAPDLARMEDALSDITHALCAPDPALDNHELLKRLSDLLAANDALSTRTAFRFSASRAYHALVTNRLELLQERKEGQYPTISNFLSAPRSGDRDLQRRRGAAKALLHRCRAHHQSDANGHYARHGAPERRAARRHGPPHTPADALQPHAAGHFGRGPRLLSRGSLRLRRQGPQGGRDHPGGAVGRDGGGFLRALRPARRLGLHGAGARALGSRRAGREDRLTIRRRAAPCPWARRSRRA